MNDRRQRSRDIVWAHLALLVLGGLAGTQAPAHGPVDLPSSFEPRVSAGKCLSSPGLVGSEGNGSRYFRITKDETLYSRDLLVAIPGFKVDVEPTSKAVKLTLWGNLPGLSDSPVLESAVVLHDSRAYDLDFSLVRGRIALTNTRSRGEARVWLRTEAGGVELTLPEPGDAIAVEIYGRWPTGVPFSLKYKTGVGPVRMWAAYCLKGRVEIKAAKTTWPMAAPPGLAYFHGNSIEGPDPHGPERLEKLPAWAGSTGVTVPALAKKIALVVQAFSGRLVAKDPDEVATELLGIAEKLPDKERAAVIRGLVVHALGALDEVGRVTEMLETSPHPEVRNAAILGLRHWIGVREGRDEKLYDILQSQQHYTASEAETILQLLHSPFDPEQAETYETLIAYLGHRKQAVRELAHWHLVRLARAGKDIPYDASAAAADRQKAIAAWKELIPAGTVPKRPEDKKSDETKKKPD